jgi:hypothetical protein
MSSLQTVTQALTDPGFAATLLEGLMLVCFGIAWPVANVRMLRSGKPEGKGLAFTLIILCGYVAGGSAKLLPAGSGHALQPVFWLYALNTLSVGINLGLQAWLARRRQGRVQGGRFRRVQLPTSG